MKNAAGWVGVPCALETQIQIAVGIAAQQIGCKFGVAFLARDLIEGACVFAQTVVELVLVVRVAAGLAMPRDVARLRQVRGQTQLHRCNALAHQTGLAKRLAQRRHFNDSTQCQRVCDAGWGVVDSHGSFHYSEAEAAAGLVNYEASRRCGDKQICEPSKF